MDQHRVWMTMRDMLLTWYVVTAERRELKFTPLKELRKLIILKNKTRHRLLDGAVLTLLWMVMFMIVFPVAEFNIDCPMAATDPDGNEACITIKSFLWHTVFIMSLGQDGDGFALTENLEEIHYRNIIPLSYALIIVLLYQNSKLRLQ